MTKQEVLDLMKSSKSESEWYSNCDIVKSACRRGIITERSGHYPAYWFTEIIMSGMLHKLRSQWK